MKRFLTFHRWTLVFITVRIEYVQESINNFLTLLKGQMLKCVSILFALCVLSLTSVNSLLGQENEFNCPVKLRGEGSGYKIAHFTDGTSQRIDWNAEISLELKLSNPTVHGDIFVYKTPDRKGSVRFWGEAVDDHPTLGKTWNFDRTQNINVKGGEGELHYSSSKDTVIYVDFDNPPSITQFPSVTRMSFFGSNPNDLDSIRLYVDIPNDWLFDNDIYHLPGTVSLNRKQGTTVIVHGLNFHGILNGDKGLNNQEDWTLTMAKAIANRLGAGQVYIIVDGNINLYKSVGIGGENIIVFDWLGESNKPAFGYAEGAADALAALLIQGALEGKWTLDQLHFIGHSRGAVVSSETIQRLGMFADPSLKLLPSSLSIDQNIHFTLLDPHPWDNGFGDGIGDPGSVGDHDVNTPRGEQRGIICWDNISYADNYWQNKDVRFPFLWKGWFNLNGWSNPISCNNGTNNFHLTKLSREGGHGEIHAWYHGTIDTLANDDGSGIEIKKEWYDDPPGSRNQLGFNLSISAKCDGLPDQIKLSSSEKWNVDQSLKPEQVFNGDFEMFDAGVFHGGKNFPGWSYQGGGGIPPPTISGNLSIRLETNKVKYTHNWFFIPQNAEEIHFKLKVEEIREKEGGTLQVKLIEKNGQSQEEPFIIGSILLQEITLNTDIVLSVPIGIEHRGSVKKLEFALDAIALQNFTVSIDDIGFSLPSYIMVARVSPSSENTIQNKSITSFALHAYNTAGNHTGPTSDTTIAEEIPGSRYLITRDSLGIIQRAAIKLPQTPLGTEYTFKIEPSGQTSFSDILIDDVESQIKTALFRNVNFGPKTMAKVTFNDLTNDINLMVDQDGDDNFETIIAQEIVTGDNSLITEFHENYLKQNEPNPFQYQTTIKYHLPKTSIVDLSIYNSLGKKIKVLVKERQHHGKYQIEWDGRNDDGDQVSNGIYVYRLQTESFMEEKKMILIR